MSREHQDSPAELKACLRQLIVTFLSLWVSLQQHILVESTASMLSDHSRPMVNSHRLAAHATPIGITSCRRQAAVSSARVR